MFSKMLVAVGLVCGIALTWEPAEAQLRWFGFSTLKFEGEWRGGPCTDCSLEITLIDFTVQTRCDNLQVAAEQCSPGQGNAGNLVFALPTQCENCEKNKGVITASGEIDLSAWDDHRLHTEFPENHTCNPVTNPNKVERLGSAYVAAITTAWTLKDAKGGTLREGSQECFWPGSFNEDPQVCAPDQHDVQFICPVDSEVAIKGKKVN